MTDAAKNLMIARGEKSVWDKPGLAAMLSTYDTERWLTAAVGSILASIGTRRGGMLGGVLAVSGIAVAARAAMGRRDFSAARDCLDRILQERGWRHMDLVAESSDESFPASDSPSWTSGAGTRMDG